MSELVPVRRALRGTLGGSDACNTPAPSHVYPRGRVCLELDCDTVLSIYNPQDVCAQHGTYRLAPESFTRQQSSPKRDRAIVQMWLEGETTAAVAAVFGLGVDRVRQIVKAGLTTERRLARR